MNDDSILLTNGKVEKEQGAALIMALVMLLVLTLLGISGMKTSVMNLTLSQSFQDYDYAFQSAESGLRYVEKIIEGSASESDTVTQLNALDINMISSDSGDYSSNAFWDGVDFMGSQKNIKVVVENYQTVEDSLDMSASSSSTTYYKITVRGIDPTYLEYLDSGNSENLDLSKGVVIIQSIYAKRY